MNEAILGVIIGGAIASITPLISVIDANRRWRIEQKIAYLKIKKDQLNQCIPLINELIGEAKNTGVWKYNKLQDLRFNFSQEVMDALRALVLDRDKSFQQAQNHCRNIDELMRKEVKQIEFEIEKSLGIDSSTAIPNLGGGVSDISDDIRTQQTGVQSPM